MHEASVYLVRSIDMKQHVIGAAVVAALLATSACSDDQAPAPKAVVVAPKKVVTHEIPTISTDRAVTDNAQLNYVTGGIGDDERAAIEAEKGSYNTHITNASVKGAFVEDTTIVVKDKTGAELLSVNAGPLTYIQLPVGSYTIEASHNGEVKSHKVNIGKKTKVVTPNFAWKVPTTITE